MGDRAENSKLLITLGLSGDRLPTTQSGAHPSPSLEQKTLLSPRKLPGFRELSVRVGVKGQYTISISSRSSMPPGRRKENLLGPTPLPSPRSDSLFLGQRSSSEGTVGRPGGTPTSLQGATRVEQCGDTICLFHRVDICTECATRHVMKVPAVTVSTTTRWEKKEECLKNVLDEAG